MTSILVVFAVVTLAVTTSAPAAPLPRIRHPIAVIAHRGGTSIGPENTLAAFREAVRLGVDFVEIDVRATRDGRLVLMHDRTVDRTTNGTGAVTDLDLAAIRRLDAGMKTDPRFAGERVPTLDEALAFCRGKVNVYLDHKSGSVEQVLRAVRSHRMVRRIVVYSGLETLREWKRLAPSIPVMPDLPDEYRRPGGLAAFRARFPAEVLDGNIVSWTKTRVAEAHAAGFRVYVDNLGPNDNPDGFRNALEMGVDGIQTDYPDRLLEYIRCYRGR